MIWPFLPLKNYRCVMIHLHFSFVGVIWYMIMLCSLSVPLYISFFFFFFICELEQSNRPVPNFFMIITLAEAQHFICKYVCDRAILTSWFFFIRIFFFLFLKLTSGFENVWSTAKKKKKKVFFSLDKIIQTWNVIVERVCLLLTTSWGIKSWLQSEWKWICLFHKSVTGFDMTIQFCSKKILQWDCSPSGLKSGQTVYW